MDRSRGGRPRHRVRVGHPALVRGTARRGGRHTDRLEGARGGAVCEEILAESDIERDGALVIAPTGTLDDQAGGPVSAAEMARFLELAVPALADYQCRKDSAEAGQATPPEPPESLAENQFWLDFLDERDEILWLKWIESEKAGRDIGYERAIQLWLKHRPGWRSAHAAVLPAG